MIVARPAPNLLLVRHEAVAALGMDAMELMAIAADPAQLDAADPRPGERVRWPSGEWTINSFSFRLERVPSPTRAYAPAFSELPLRSWTMMMIRTTLRAPLGA